MWIISTFDPKFQRKILNESIEKYWSEKIILIKKSKFFLWTRVVIPFVFWTAILFIALVIFVNNINVDWFLWSLIVLSVILWIIPNLKILNFYLDYKMDFIIVNPRAFVRYDQEWFFRTVSKTIDLKKIRSISVRREWFLNSIFNNGTLVVLSEWWESEPDESLKAGEIIFRYLYSPDSYNKKINDLINETFTK